MSLIDGVRSALPDASGRDAALLSPLVLAYIGDTVYDLYVRTHLVLTHDGTAHTLHMMAAKRVCARAQAEAFRRIEGELTGEELSVFKRGRNAHMGTVPKHASISDYRAATGVEALFGFLYLQGRDERLETLMSLALKEE